jgi:hypothetical protein
LFTRRSSFASRLTLSANARTDRRFAKSSVSKCTLADGSSRRIRSTVSRPFASDRAARITSLPARASSSAVCQPIPLFAPVTTASFPVWGEYQ